MIFRQLFDAASSTYTYVLGDAASGEALIVDPVLEQWPRDAALLRELGLNPVATLDTHVHADHVTGAWCLRREFGCSIALAAEAGAEGVDRPLRDEDRIAFGGRYLEARATPGHTRGCMSFVLDDQGLALTGDCLLIRGTGRTDFQGGDSRTMFRSIRDRLFTLPPQCLVYPGHDYRGLTSSSIGEERRFNPRVGEGIGVDDFTGYMRNLGLPHPKLLEIAVPANLRSGRLAGGAEPAASPRWAPLRFTVAGIWEIEPAALAESSAGLQLIDVREPEEFASAPGHIRGARLIPLAQLADRAAEIAPDLPVVTVCRSGARSAQAAVLLQRAGRRQVANLAGGMLRWIAEGHPLES